MHTLQASSSASHSKLRLLDLFSGIGGFSYAAEHIVGGFTTVQFVEREPFCQRILRKHWPDVPIHDDITTFNPEPGSADVVCGGFPCQDISTAGKQAGIKQGTRSGLFYELIRVVCLVRPQYVILENVAAILANGLDTVLGTLAEAGFDAEWACIPASAVGACHRRDRWWCVAYPNSLAGRIRREQLRGDTQTGKHGQRGQDSDWGPGRLFGAGSQATPNTAHPSLMLSHGSSGQQHREPHGQPIPQPRDRDWQTPNSDHSGLEGRQSASLRQRPIQRLAWPRDTPSLNPDWRSYLSEPVLRRGDDGLSARVDRLKALGNAVVPQVAAIPLARVLELATSSGTGNLNQRPLIHGTHL